jgi:alkylation response protein AidB-like acyl-CoA dehydrogenase
MLHDSVADFIARGTDIKRVRRLRGTQPGFERTVWRQMAELGWLGILVPEEYGGLGLGCTEMAIVA